jgi:hypothetical protein
VCIYSLILQGLISIPWFYFVVFMGEIGENPQGKSMFPVCACAVWVWLTCACVFANKTMAVRIFRSAKIENFGGIIFPMCTCFDWGATDSDKVVFIYWFMCKLRSYTRGATELHLLDAHPTAYNQTSGFCRSNIELEERGRYSFQIVWNYSSCPIVSGKDCSKK